MTCCPGLTTAQTLKPRSTTGLLLPAPDHPIPIETMVSKAARLVLLFCLSYSSNAFVPSTRQRAAFRVPPTTQMQAVIEIGSEADFDKTIKDSGSALVVVDYSTTWCGPCKGKIYFMVVRCWQLAGRNCVGRPNGCLSTIRASTRVPGAIPQCRTSLIRTCSLALSRSLSIAVIAPKFEEFSDQYTDAVFLKVIGDASPDASKLMKREGVRTVPSFHYFVNGQKVDVINGANAEAIEAAITKHTR
jgi:thiol-disulfide isomerase/thioredoxin